MGSSSITMQSRHTLHGPYGRGEIEVVVCSLVNQGKEDLSHHSRKGFGIVRFVRRVASVAAKHAYVAAYATPILEAEMLSVKCCLMFVFLPWEHIAHDLVFKNLIYFHDNEMNLNLVYYAAVDIKGIDTLYLKLPMISCPFMWEKRLERRKEDLSNRTSRVVARI
ncbi:hypothetical protein M9H77_23194 [Catharanthus roseus]|uniref:Uncharacterized protein n=1 Tax=Catharanthus roseus TaxID=4058 RepID=A0ACC0AWM9_CATRO|nr:hypothetical protein M9H77_23194 [Catharanthus roseus]